MPGGYGSGGAGGSRPHAHISRDKERMRAVGKRLAATLPRRSDGKFAPMPPTIPSNLDLFTDLVSNMTEAKQKEAAKGPRDPILLLAVPILPDAAE